MNLRMRFPSLKVVKIGCQRGYGTHRRILVVCVFYRLAQRILHSRGNEGLMVKREVFFRLETEILRLRCLETRSDADDRLVYPDEDCGNERSFGVPIWSGWKARRNTYRWISAKNTGADDYDASAGDRLYYKSFLLRGVCYRDIMSNRKNRATFTWSITPARGRTTCTLRTGIALT